jgi:hypothetical protein
MWRSNDDEFHVQTSHSPLEPVRRGTFSGAASPEALASFLRVSAYAICRGTLLETKLDKSLVLRSCAGANTVATQWRTYSF